MIAFLGWTIVHAAWQGGIIAAAVAALLWLTRRAAASTRYVIALVGLALTVVAPIATTLSRDESRSAAWMASVEQAVAATQPEPVMNPDTPGAVPAVGSSRWGSLTWFVSGRIDAALPWLVSAWLVGVALLSIRVVAGVATVRRLSHRGVSAADASLRIAAERVAGRLGMRSAIRVLQSTHVDVPMVVGWLKPAVIVPASLLTGTLPAQLDMLLAHELAHVRRYDTVVNLAQTIVETLLFYHPAIWWISARVREEREHCCDDLAIAACGNDRPAYSAVLLMLEESRGSSLLAAAATDGSLLRRVRRILIGTPNRMDLGQTWFAGVATMLAVLLVAIPNAAPAASRVTVPSILWGQVDTTTGELIPLRSQSPVTPTGSTPMTRSVLVAGAAAISLAAANPPIQRAPNFAGSWVLVTDATGKPVQSGRKALTIEQTERTVVFIADSAKVTYAIATSDSRSISAKGPIAVGFQSGEFTIDSVGPKLRLRAEWGGFSLDISTVVDKFTLNTGIVTLSFDDARNLVYQVDFPADGNQPAKRTVQRFRRFRPV